MQLDEESLNLFVMDMEEDIYRIDSGLLELEDSGQDPDLINRIMRAAHNIKGSSGMVGFNRMKDITHAIESVMVDVRNDKIKITRSLISLLLKCMDRIKALKDQFLKGNIDIEVADLVEQLRSAGQVESRQETPEKNLPQPVDTAAKKRVKQEEMQAVKADSIQTVKVKVKSIENMVDQINELIIFQTQLHQLNKGLKKQYVKEPGFKESLEMLEYMGRTLRRLQDELMQSKMTSMEVVFRNFPRMIRELEISLNKSINLVIDNSDTRLDRSIAEEISNPLIHIIRNSADHGIEWPEERVKIGKPEKGTIRISTLQKGEQIIISVEDDGKGIDEDKVIESALAKGLITQEEAGRLTKRDALNLIFRPGFSTADKVSDISGRGVGMDVVLTHIEKINGTIEIESEKGKGTRMTLKIPSTMTIVPCVLIEINKKILCLPAVNVDNVITVSAGKSGTKDGNERITVADKGVTLVRLHDKFGGTPVKHGGNYYVIVIGLAEKRVGIIVDRLLGGQRVIVKPLSSFLGKIQNIAGTTILEDGKIGLVLDVADLVTNNYVL